MDWRQVRSLVVIAASLSYWIMNPKEQEADIPLPTPAEAPALEPLDDGYKGDPLKFKIESIVKSKRLCPSDEYENICRGFLGDTKFLLVRDDASLLFNYAYSAQFTQANVSQTDYAMSAFDRLCQVVGTNFSKELLQLLKLERLSPNLFPESSKLR